MQNPATYADVENRWRPLTPQEQIVARTLIADAWAILTGPTARPQLPTDLDAGTVSQDQVRRVVATMVLRVLKNPEGRRQGTRTIDDYTEGWTLADTVADGSLYVSPDELATLTPSPAAATPVATGAFTIRQVAEPYITIPCPDLPLFPHVR